MLALVLQERHTQAAIALMDQWVAEGIDLHAPLLAQYEIANTLTRKRAQGDISKANVDAALAVVDDLEVSFHVTQDNARIIEIALELQRHSAYDAVYLELAERLDAEVWTLDGPLARNAGHAHRVTLIE